MILAGGCQDHSAVTPGRFQGGAIRVSGFLALPHCLEYRPQGSLRVSRSA
jgi:hypothetical protein